MAKTTKGMATKIARLEARIVALKSKTTKAKSGPKVYDATAWKGAAPTPLGVYYIRIMRDAEQVGGFGPYATVRAAAADGKNILRLNVGPGHKIVETGPVVPVIRSDGRIKLYLHPESYSTQIAGKGILSAQVIEIAGNEERKKEGPDDLGTFGVKYNPRRRNGGSERDTLEAEIKALEASLPADAVRDARDECGMGKGPGVSVFDTRYQLKQYLTELRREEALRQAKPLREAYLAKRRRRANPRVAFKTRSGKTVSFDAKHRNPSYGSGLDESAKIVVEGVKGMKSTPFRKTFRNFAAYLKWSDSDAAANCSIYRVSNE